MHRATDAKPRTHTAHCTDAFLLEPDLRNGMPEKNLPRRLANRKDGETDASVKRPLLAARCPLGIACTKMGAPRVVAQGDGRATAHRAVKAHRITHGA